MVRDTTPKTIELPKLLLFFPCKGIQVYNYVQGEILS